jgi:predicted amidophosphoribosyltransferase
MEVLKFKSRPDMIIVPMFTSKSRNDPEFDDRLECVAKYVREKTSQRIGFNLDVIRSSEPFHNSRALRVPAEIEKTISFTPFKPPIPTKVLLIDDVVTTGAHFIACNNKIKGQYPDIEIFGLFLAKTKWEVTEPQHSSDTNSVSDEFFGK